MKVTKGVVLDHVIFTDEVHGLDLEFALKVERTLFDEAQQKVVSLMACDSFVRFKNQRRRTGEYARSGRDGDVNGDGDGDDITHSSMEPLVEMQSISTDGSAAA